MPKPTHYARPGFRLTACGRVVEPCRNVADWSVTFLPSNACRYCLRAYHDMTTVVCGGHTVSIPPCPGVTVGDWRDGGFIRLLPADKTIEPEPWLREVALCARSVTDGRAVIEAVLDRAWDRWGRKAPT